MSPTPQSAATALRLGAHELAEAARDVEATEIDAADFGAGGPGELGRLGRDLHEKWSRALLCRSRELSVQSDRHTAAAAAADQALRAYVDADDAAGGALPEVM